jgi:hypothetical protein
MSKSSASTSPEIGRKTQEIVQFPYSERLFTQGKRFRWAEYRRAFHRKSVALPFSHDLEKGEKFACKQARNTTGVKVFSSSNSEINDEIPIRFDDPILGGV